MRALFLASTSPRRHALLRRAGIDFVLHPPGAEPESHGSPAERAQRRARAKACDAPRPSADGLILGVDTVVDVDGCELGKPADRAAAAAMLARLGGREHRVHTGHCLVDVASGRLVEGLATATVRCAELDAAAIEGYLDSGDWQGKAGAYGIQGDAGAFMELVEGGLDTVIGLHVATVERLLRDLR